MFEFWHKNHRPAPLNFGHQIQTYFSKQGTRHCLIIQNKISDQEIDFILIFRLKLPLLYK